MKISKIVILGGGNLGFKLKDRLSTEHTVYVLGKEEYNIVSEQEKILDFCKKQKIDMVINCAAKTDVDWCETHQRRAWDINAKAPLLLYDKMTKTKSCPVKWFIGFSSEMVFDGKKDDRYLEDDKHSAINYYGKTKQALEVWSNMIYKHANNQSRVPKVRYTILRTSWLYHHGFSLGIGDSADWPSAMLRKLQERKKLYVATDVRGCPTRYIDVCIFIESLIHRLATLRGKQLDDYVGVFNVCGTRSVSRARWLQKIADDYTQGGQKLGCRWIEEVTYDEYRAITKERARRPTHAVLDNSKARKLLNWDPTNWNQGLSWWSGSVSSLMFLANRLREEGKLRKELHW